MSDLSDSPKCELATFLVTSSMHDAETYQDLLQEVAVWCGDFIFTFDYVYKLLSNTMAIDKIHPLLTIFNSKDILIHSRFTANGD